MSIYGQLIKGMRYVAPKAFKGVVDKVRGTISPSRSVFIKDIDMHISDAAKKGVKTTRKEMSENLSQFGKKMPYGKTPYAHEKMMPRSDVFARDKIRKELLSDESFNKFMANAEEGYFQESAQLFKLRMKAANGDYSAAKKLIELYEQNMSNRFTHAARNLEGIPDDGIWGDLYKFGKRPGKSNDIGQYIEHKLNMISKKAGYSREKLAAELYKGITKNSRNSLSRGNRESMRKLYNARVEESLKRIKSKVTQSDDALAYHKAGLHDAAPRIGVDVGHLESYKLGAETVAHEMKHVAQSGVAGRMFPSIINPRATMLGGTTTNNLVNRGADVLSLPHRGKIGLDRGRGISKRYWKEGDKFRGEWDQRPWEKSAVMTEYRQMSPFEKNILKKYMNANSRTAQKIYKQTIENLGLNHVKQTINRIGRMWKPAGGEANYTSKKILKNFLDKEKKMWAAAPGLLGVSQLSEKDK